MPSVNDKVLDEITGHSVDVLRLEAGIRSKVLKELAKLEKRLLSILRDSEIDGITEFQKRRVSAMLKQTRETIQAAYAGIAELALGEYEQLALFAEEQAVGTINTAIKAEVLSVGLSTNTLAAIASDTLIQGAPSSEWWGRQDKQLADRFTDAIRQGMLAGETNQQLVQRVRGTRVARFKDGIMETTRRNAEALVRTSVQTVANEARMQTYRDNDDIIKGIEWVSTLDNRTTDICKGLDGLQWDNDMEPIGHAVRYPGPTAHYNCRSTQVPVLKSWEELGAKRKFNEIPASTRASMDGQVSEKHSYETWLKNKPVAFQKEVLGPTKYKLWKEGKLSFIQLIDQTGRAATVAELRAKL